MSVPMDLFESLRLSGNAGFQSLTPQLAAAYASSIRELLAGEDIRAALMELGGPSMVARAAGIVDVPTDPVAISDQRARLRASTSRGVGTRIGEGFAQTMESFGLGDILANLGSVAQGGPWQSDSNVEAGMPKVPMKSESTDIPLMGRQDPVALGAQIASFLAPAVASLGGAGAAVGLTGLEGAGASIATFALGGGALEAARQTIRSQTKGEEFDPANVAIESAIWAAGGTPVGGGFLGSRARAGIMSGAAASLVPWLFGKEVDPTRVASEAAFGALFGNPRIKAELGTALPPARVEGPVTPKPSPTEGSAPRVETQWGAALKRVSEEPGATPEVAKELADRAKAVEMLIRESGGINVEAASKLEALLARPDNTPAEAVIIRDAVVAERGEILVAPDAPMAKVLEPKEWGATIPPESEQLIGSLAQRAVTSKVFMAPKGDPQFIADAGAFKALTRGDVSLKSRTAKDVMAQLGPDKRMQLFLSLEDAREQIKLDRLGKNLEALDEVQLDNLAIKRIGLTIGPEEVSWNPTRLFPDTTQRLRQLVVDEWKLEETSLVEKERIAAAEEAPDTLLEQLQKSIELAKTEGASASQPAGEFHIPGSMLRNVVDDVTAEMTPAQVRDFANNLPAPLKEHEVAIRGDIERVIRERPNMQKLADEADELLSQLEDRGEFFVNTRGGTASYTGKRKLTAAGRTLNDMQKRVADLDGDLKFEDGQYKLRVSGNETTLGTLKEVDSFVKNVEELLTGKRPKDVDRATLEALAKRKLVAVQHVGAGQYQTVNMATGEQVIHKNMDDAVDAVIAQPTPPAMELAPSVGVGGGGAGSVGGAGHDGRMPYEAPTSPSAFPGGIALATGTRGEVLQRMQDATNVPVWDDIWEPMMRAGNDRDRWQKPIYDQLNSVLRGVKPARRRAVQDLLIAGKAIREVGKQLKATKAEYAAAAGMRNFYGKLLGLDHVQLDEFLETAIPEFRRAGGDPSRVRQDWTLPGSLETLVDDIFEGHVNLMEPHAGVLASDIIQAVGRRQFMDPAIKRAQHLQGYMRRRAVQKDVPFAERRNLDTMTEYTNKFMDAMIFGDHGDVGAATAKFIAPFFQALRDRGLLKNTEVPSKEDVSRWATELTSHASSAALSARPAMAIRNMFQRMLVGDKVGYGTLMRGWGDFHTPEGRAMVKESGVVPEQVIWEVDNTATLLGGGDFKNFVLQMGKIGMTPYRRVESSNRAVAYLTGMRAVRDNAELLTKGKIEEFLVRSGLATESATVQNRVMNFLQDVHPAQWPEALKKAGNEYGLRLAEETQFIYHRANAPNWMNNVPGRLGGQFGLWSINYAEHIIRNSRGVSGKRGTARATAARHFMARTAASTGALIATGWALGMDTSSFNRANPLAWEFGPMVQALRDLVTITAQTEGEFGQRLARRNLLRFLSTFGMPFGGAYEDVMQGLEKQDPVEALLTILGFTTTGGKTK